VSSASLSLPAASPPVAPSAAVASNAALWAAGLIAYALVCRFASFLFCGQLFGVDRVPFRPAEIYRFPVSIFEFPWQTVVIGLVLGTWLLGPPMVAQLARRRWGLAYALIAVCLGPSIVVGLVLVAGVLVADMQWTRRLLPSRTLTAGVLLPIAYLMLVAAQVPAGGLTTGQRLLLLLPTLIAVSVAGLGSFAFQTTRQVTPGQMKVFLALLMAPPALAAVIFRASVGVDEVTYPVLDRQWGPESGHFVNLPLSAIVPRVDEWDRQFDGEDGQPRRSLESVEAALVLQNYLHETKVEKIERFGRFLKTHPGSRHAPRALYNLARTLDTKLDARAVVQHKYLCFYDTEVSKLGMREWRRLAETYPANPYAAAARLRMADYRLREGDLGRAAENLGLVVGSFGKRADRLVKTREAWAVGKTVAAEWFAQRRLLVLAVTEARGQLRFLSANGSDGRTLAAMCRLRPHDPTYARQLKALVKDRPDSPLADDLALASVLAEWDRRTRIRQLTAFWPQHRDSDVGQQALVALVRTWLAVGRSPTESAQSRHDSLGEAESYARQFIRTYPDSHWVPLVLDLQSQIALQRRILSPV